MSTEEICKIAGRELVSIVMAGKYGDATLHDNGYVSGDPCYFHEIGWYVEFGTAAREQQPDAYFGRDRNWVPFKFMGETCYFISCSDGNGPLFHCVDSGWVAVIPLDCCPESIQKIIWDAFIKSPAAT